MSRFLWPVRSARAILAILALVLVAVAAAGAADAHDVLVSTSPANGAQVATAPSQVSLRFDQTVLGLGTEVVVTGPHGPVQVGKPSVVDTTVTERLQPGAPAGRYTVNWRVTSVDGHPVSGTFTFTAAAAGKGGAPSATAATGTTTGASASSASSSAGSSVPWALVAATVLLVVLVGAATLWSRRRSAAPHNRP